MKGRIHTVAHVVTETLVLSGCGGKEGGVPHQASNPQGNQPQVAWPWSLFQRRPFGAVSLLLDG